MAVSGGEDVSEGRTMLAAPVWRPLAGSATSLTVPRCSAYNSRATTPVECQAFFQSSIFGFHGYTRFMGLRNIAGGASTDDCLSVNHLSPAQCINYFV